MTALSRELTPELTPGWPWSLPIGPYQGPAAGYAHLLNLPSDALVYVRHRIGLGTGAGRFASRVVVPAAAVAARPELGANPFRQLRDLDAVLTAAGHRPTTRTRVRRVHVSADLAAVFGHPATVAVHRVTVTLHDPTTGRPLVLADHLSGWTTAHPGRNRL